MVTATEGLSADELPTASDPISLRQHFWDALAVADESLAVDAANRVGPPAVAMDTFDFEDVDDVVAREDSEEGRCWYCLLSLVFAWHCVECLE